MSRYANISHVAAGSMVPMMQIPLPAIGGVLLAIMAHSFNVFHLLCTGIQAQGGWNQLYFNLNIQDLASRMRF